MSDITLLRAALWSLILVVSAASAAVAQVQCNAIAEPSLIRESSPTAHPTQTFCDANIEGSDACVGNTSKVEFYLVLESVDDIDLNCWSDYGVICAMDSTCTELLAGGTGPTLRLIGPVPSTDLRIVAAAVGPVNLCENALDPTVTCNGSFGGRAIIDTNFEAGFKEQGWSVSNCPDCVASSALLAAGASFFPRPEGFRVDRPTEHLALLEPGPHLEAELVLLKREGEEWVEVAVGRSYGRLRVVSWQGPPGIYRWEVRGIAGEGHFTLWRSPPNDLGGGADE